MIEIQRAPRPAILSDSSSDAVRYNRTSVVETLWEMQNGKCCYCEQIIPRKGHAKAVEHFRPKSIFKDLKNDWMNLLLACAQCNGKKWARFPVLTGDPDNPKIRYLTTASKEKPAIIDPSKTDPEKHLNFEFSRFEADNKYGGIVEKNGSLIGRTTIQTIGLGGEYFTRKRYSYYRDVIYWRHFDLLKAKSEGNERLLESRKTDFRSLMSAKKEFAAFTRAYARYNELDAPPIGLEIPVGSEI